MVGLGTLPLPGSNFNGSAFATSADGSVVVGRISTLSSPNVAFLWTASMGMRSLKDMLVNDFGLDLTGWTLSFATGISDDGLTIVGTGGRAGLSFSKAWIARLPTPVCGNGIFEIGEDCDDGNNVDGDGCNSGCLFVCGDGTVTSPETCDPPGSPAGPSGNTCRADCTVCGDGILDAGEDCDDAGESTTCDVDCTLAVCGDAMLNNSAGEQCDSGIGCTNCLCSLDFEPTTPQSVNCQPICGNGILDSGEQCDDAGESPTCDVDCTLAVCGDATLNNSAGEQCDDGNQNDDDVCLSTCLNNPKGIPAVSQWGLLVMGLLVLTAGSIVMRRGRTAVA